MSDIFCRHFPPMGIMNDTCKVGINMQSVADPEARPLRLPCNDPSAKHLCARREEYTDEEIADQNRALGEFLKKLDAVAFGLDSECPHCGAHIEAMAQVGKCVYARPCGCRQYQGKVPDKWNMGKESED